MRVTEGKPSNSGEPKKMEQLHKNFPASKSADGRKGPRDGLLELNFKKPRWVQGRKTWGEKETWELIVCGGASNFRKRDKD